MIPGKKALSQQCNLNYILFRDTFGEELKYSNEFINQQYNIYQTLKILPEHPSFQCQNNETALQLERLIFNRLPASLSGHYQAAYYLWFKLLNRLCMINHKGAIVIYLSIIHKTIIWFYFQELTTNRLI